MKRMLSLALLCTLLLSMLPSCSGTISCPIGGYSAAAKPLTAPKLSVNPSGSEEVSGALASFGLELLQRTRTANWEKALKRAVISDSPSFSTLVSPLSVALALSMAANGADGNTLDQFSEVLGGGADINTLNAACAQLTQDYQNLGGSTRCSIANSLWVDPQGQIGEDFIGRCLGAFDAQLFQAELSDRGIVKALNGWVSDHTNKLIPKIIDEPFDDTVVCLLVNALYLKNKWLREFNPQNTHAREFTHENDSKTRMDFLHKGHTELTYLQGKGAQGAVLPYDDGRLAFFVLMPDLYPDAPSFGEWLSALEGNALSQILVSREPDTLFLQFAMPKFTAEWRGDLTEILPEMGLEDAFDMGKANFSRMGDLPEGYFISKVVHAAKIEVNEKGTEAAAVTVVANSGGASPSPEGISLILDRPFLYGIVDLDTNVPLFLGTYE